MSSTIGEEQVFVLPERIRRELQKGETIWHSQSACHVSKRFPTGKWMAQTRREEHGRLVKYPIKGFGTPQECLAYLKTLRPNAAGKVTARRSNEPTVHDLYEYARAHTWKRLSERRKAGKESRWRLHIAPYWSGWALSQVTRRAAQEWITEREAAILAGEAGTLGIPQLLEVRTDLNQLFELAADVDEGYGERRNPFQGLSFVDAEPRSMITMESPQFSPILNACYSLVDENLAVPWIVEMFATSLLSGLREGEVVALMANRIDFKKGVITVDRALKLKAQDVDDESGVPKGPILRVALGLPKKNKTRVVPLSDQLASILQPLVEQTDMTLARPFLWANASGGMKELNRFHNGFKTLRKRLDLLANLKEDRWSVFNALVDEHRADSSLRIPKIFDRLDFRDTRNSFASYANEVGIPQATREAILGHSKGVTNVTYTDITERAMDDARERLSSGWSWNRG